MKPTVHQPDEELQELHHEEQPGYRLRFWIVLSVTTLVLVIAATLGPDVTGHH